MAFLIIETGPEQGRKVDLGGPLVIGRQAQVGLSIKDTKASREHTRIEPAAGGWAVVDLGSTNGTQLNGRKIERDFLKSGDRVTVGQTVFRFEEADANPEATTRPMKDPMAAQRAAAPGDYPPAASPRTPRPMAPSTPRPDPSPARGVSPIAAAAAAVPAVEQRGPKLRHQATASGPGFLTIMICTVILVGLVFAARWIVQRGIAKAILERTQGQHNP